MGRKGVLQWQHSFSLALALALTLALISLSSAQGWKNIFCPIEIEIFQLDQRELQEQLDQQVVKDSKEAKV